MSNKATPKTDGEKIFEALRDNLAKFCQVNKIDEISAIISTGSQTWCITLSLDGPHSEIMILLDKIHKQLLYELTKGAKPIYDNQGQTSIIP